MASFAKKWSLVALAILVSASLSACHKDEDDLGWRGTLDLRQRGRAIAIASGEVFGRSDGAMLFNLTYKGHEMSVVDDPGLPTPITLIHLLRKYAKMRAGEIENATLFSCRPGKFEECMTQNRFNKVGEETIDGHPCEIRQGATIFQNQPLGLRIWHPKDLPLVYWIKAVAEGTGGIIVDGSLTHVRSEKVDAGLFALPGDYTLFKAN